MPWVRALAPRVQSCAAFWRCCAPARPPVKPSSRPTGLRYLDLSSSRLSAASAGSLVQAVLEGTLPLVELNLHGNGLGEAGCVEIVKLMKQPTTVKILKCVAGARASCCEVPPWCCVGRVCILVLAAARGVRVLAFPALARYRFRVFLHGASPLCLLAAACALLPEVCKLADVSCLYASPPRPP